MDSLNQYATPSSNLVKNEPTDKQFDHEGLNPWFSMWTKPRACIQQIINGNPKYILVLWLSGFLSTFHQGGILTDGVPLELPLRILFSAILGPLIAFVLITIYCYLLRWTGNLFNGRASAAEIRIAMVWATVPVIWSSLLFIPRFVLLGEEALDPEWFIQIFVDDPHLGLTTLYTLELIITVWAIVVMLKAIGQEQGFSAWKSLGSLIVAVIVIVFVIFGGGMLMLLSGLNSF